MDKIEKLAMNRVAIADRFNERQLKDKRLASLLESERKLYEAGMSINYYVLGIALLKIISP
ncbi:hypothetical protein [Collimonas arenae]|uniref:hypothetical protein n=1 Tax=Collimonas arenae TaxID=279058 RepID=UPI0005707DE3|nr:hypothetical protein [Collimonas arenae]